MKVHCFFEQSGTFKNEFRKLGHEAYDYDILNDFGETDYVIDIFHEIETAFEGGQSIFDKISQDDLIMAFFPCIRFEDQILLHFRGDAFGMNKWDLKKKMLNCMKLQEELNELYMLVNKLFVVCMDRGLKLIMENPYSEMHYLRQRWCYKPSVIDSDRRNRGDYYKKPTQYWFLNCEPSNNFIFETPNNNTIDCKDPIKKMTKTEFEKLGAKNRKVARSMIHPDYANRFIREFVL